MLLAQGGESGLPIPVGGQRGQKGVVHPLHHPVIAPAAEPIPVDLIAGVQGVEQLRFGRFFGIPALRRRGHVGLGVERRQSGLGPHEQIGKPVPMRLLLLMRCELIGPALNGKPLAGALLANKAGEGLVQRHVIGHPEPLVRCLMDQQFRQLRLRPINEGAQQRIIEPAERGIGGDPTDIGLQALARQVLRGAAGGIEREVASIGGAASERMAPLTSRQREGGRGEDIPQHMAALKAGEAPVAAAGVQAHFRLGELQNLPNSPQSGLEQRRGGRVLQQRIDRLRCPQHPPMPAHRLGVVAEVCAAAHPHRQQQHKRWHPPSDCVVCAQSP